MKKIITTVSLLFCLTSIAQQHNNFRGNTVDHFNYFIVVDPVASIDDGLNIGVGIEAVSSINGVIPIYVGVQYRTMPVLEDGYNEFVGRIGLPFVSGFYGEWEYRVGIELGFVRRYDWSPTFSYDVGLAKSFGDSGIYLFTRLGRQKREDFKLYDAPAVFQWKGDVGIGCKF